MRVNSCIHTGASVSLTYRAVDRITNLRCTGPKQMRERVLRYPLLSPD